MSEMSNFDDFARKQLGNYSPEVPPYVWDNIIAKREKKKPYPFLLKFFNRKNLLLAAALLILLTGSLFILNNHRTVLSNKSEVITNKSTGKKAETTTGALNKQENELTKNNTSDAKNNNADQHENISNHPVIAIAKYNTGNFNNTASIGSSADALLKNGSQNKSVTAVNKQGKYIYTKSKATIKSSRNDAEAFTDEATASPGNKSDENKINEVNFSLLLYNPEKITAGSLKETVLKKNILANLQLIPCPTIEKNAAGNKYYIEMYAGPDYASKSFSDTANSVLLQKRKESTSFRSAFSAGFRYTRVFNNGVSFRAGFNYSQINEKFTYVQSNIVQVTYITDPVTGDTTGTFLTRGTRYKTTNNKYHTIDVPLLLGFETGNGRLHANFNAGVALNIYSWQKGESLDTSFRPVSITTGKTALLYQYKTNIGVGFMGGVSIYYKLNDQLHLLAEPYLRYNFSPMNKEMLSLQEKFTTIGLRLGIRLDLN